MHQSLLPLSRVPIQASASHFGSSVLYSQKTYLKYILCSILTLLTGLINNVLYVIILTAALDLVGPSVPKAVVLLADVLPSFVTKLVAPYFIHKVPYPVRIIVFVLLSTCGMLLVALAPHSQDPRSVGIKMAGVIVASFSSGGGELSFLGLTHYYGPFSLAAWGSGTGGAGLIGAGAYVIATTTLGLGVRTSLFIFSFLPLVMLFSFFVVLPLQRLDGKSGQDTGYQAVATEEPLTASAPWDNGEGDLEGENILQASAYSQVSARSFRSSSDWYGNAAVRAWHSFKRNLVRSQGLFFP
jgi:battenin